MEDAISHTLDYKKYNLTYPSYAMTVCLPVSGGNTWSVSAAGTEILIELPPTAINLARSILYFQVNLVDNAGGMNTPNIQSWFHSGCLSFIRQMQLYTRTNTYVCDLYEAQNYTEVVWKAETKQSDFMTYDQAVNSVGGAAIPTNINNSGFSRMLQPSQVILPNLANHRHDNSNPQLAIYEPLHFYATNVYTNNAYAGNFLLNIELPLGMIYNTILAEDKDIYFGGEIMVLRLVLNGTSRFCYTTPNTATLTDPTGGGVTTVPQFNINIQNLKLYLATEQNTAIINELKAKVASPEGLSMLIPYVYTTKLSLPATTSQSMDIRYNRGHGIKLKKIYYSAFNATEQTNTSYDHSNVSNVGVAGAKIVNFYTTINNMRLQQYNVDCTNLTGQSQDWMEMQKYLKGSILSTSNLFQYYWFWIDDFSNVNCLSEKGIKGISENNLIQGLDLTNEVKWDIILTTESVGLNHYAFAITQKLMTITSNGIQVS